MARSLKKGPYIDFKLERKIDNLNSSNKKQVVKTWARRSTISPSFVFAGAMSAGITSRKKYIGNIIICKKK